MFDAFALLILVTLGYASLCAGAPFARCRACRGFGFHVTTNRRGHARRGKDCRRCHATGIRLRLGRRAYNAYQRTRNSSR